MTCGLAVCDLKLVWFPLLSCHATFGSSVRLLDVASGRDTHTIDAVVFVREKVVSLILSSCSIAVWNEGHVTVASFLRKAHAGSLS